MQLMISRCMMRAVLTLIAVLAFITNASAQCSPSCAPDKFWQGSGTEYNFNGNVPTEWRIAFGAAANEWNDAHAQYGRVEMYLDPGGGIEVVVEYPSAPGAIAEWDPAANKIRISPDYFHLSASEKKSVALHEWGHQVGFDDNWTGCSETVMTQTSNFPSSLTDYDWCGIREYYDPICEAGGGEDYENHCTPIVLSFGEGRPQFSKPRVLFDIAGNGRFATVAWTKRPYDAFLALDRDGDGLITSGKELFGNATPLAEGMQGNRAFTGFNALAVFDSPKYGGNGNRVIDIGDQVYSKLVLWFDRDHDGVCNPAELRSLADAGLDSLPLFALSLNETDSQGNILWFGTTFVYSDGHGLRFGDIVDVVFVVK